MPTQVFVVDSYPIVRFGLSTLIGDEDEFAVRGASGTVRDARQKLAGASADLLLTDLLLPDGSGLDLIRTLKEEVALKTLVFSDRDHALYARRALEAGADGYLAKTASNEDLLSALRDVAAGRMSLSQKMSNTLISQYLGSPQSVSPSVKETLSDRELEVFRLVGLGLSRQEMADALSVSPKTVDAHQNHLKEKLSLSTNAKLRRFAALWTATEG